MTTHRDPDRMIHAFLGEGAEQLHDQVYDAVRAEIEHKRQRVVIGPWRMPTLNKLVPIGLGAASVVAVLFFGSRFIGPSASSVGGPPAEPSPTPEPSVVAPSATPDAFLPVGPFAIVDQGAPNSPLRTTVTIPSSGWTSIADFGGIGKGDDADPPEAAMLAWSWPAGTTFQVYGDPCDWAGTERTPASTVNELAAALAAQPSRDASDLVDVMVGPYAGKHVTLHVPEDWDASSNDCDQGNFASYGVNGGEPARYHQGPGQIDELWILNVDGAFAILDVMYRPDTPTELIEELRSIAESATFE